jgi:S-DNA-T family DNA segregation ATPase FtsK/SpoIIIE
VHVVIVRRVCLVQIVPPLAPAASMDFTALPLAWSFLGEVFRFRLLATHVLVAGGVPAWEGLGDLGADRRPRPAVRSGLCRLWVLDPKGGMELAMGAPMFTRFAYRSAEEIAAALDDAVTVMRARQARLSGKVRVHTPTVTDPLPPRPRWTRSRPVAAALMSVEAPTWSTPRAGYRWFSESAWSCAGSRTT